MELHFEYYYDMNLRMLVRKGDKRPDLLADKLDMEAFNGYDYSDYE